MSEKNYPSPPPTSQKKETPEKNIVDKNTSRRMGIYRDKIKLKEETRRKLKIRREEEKNTR